MIGAPESSRFVSLLTKSTLALILAGGRGARLGPLTDWRAKPAVPFGGKFRIIDFPLSNCINSGIRRIAVLTQYKAHSLIRHIQRGWGFLRGEFDEFVELMPASQRVEEEAWYRGTADAVFQNIDILRAHDPQYILVLAGDHVYKMDYGPMLAFHVERKADVTVGSVEVPLESAVGLGTMSVGDDDRVLEFSEKSPSPKPIPNRHDMALASMGIYLFNTQFLYEQLARDADDVRSTHDFGRDVFPYMVPRHRVYAHPFNNSAIKTAEDGGYWRDVGTIDAYWEANMELTKVTPALNLYDANWPIWTYAEQVPPAKFVFNDDERRGMAVDSLVSGGAIVSGARVERSMLFTNVRVNSYSLVQDAVVLPDVNIGRHCRLRGVVVDKSCQLPEGLVVGEDPKADARRFHRTERGITLITPDMLGQTIHRGR